jgi:hypothetical protein
LRVGVTLAAFGYLFTRVPLGTLWNAAVEIPATAEVAAFLLVVAGTGLGAVRWRALLAACGAARTPTWPRLFRLVMIGNFYNQFVPGAVGGDIVRGVATADAFPDGGATRSLAVILLDRIMGFAGLLSLAGLAFTLHPIDGIEGFAGWVAIGAFGATLGVLLISTAGRFAARFPRALRGFAERLPEVRAPGGLLVAWVLSLGTHGTLVATGHLLVTSLAPEVPWTGSLVAMPVSNLAAYFPLTVGGAGAWEAAIVWLYARLGVAQADALAAALVLRLVVLLFGALGGIVALARPIRETE